jgi:hypothetical protein
MQRIVFSQSNGDGWWSIVMACGHRAKVLTGQEDPANQECSCFYCDRQRKNDALLDRIAAMRRAEAERGVRRAADRRRSS